MSCTCTEYHYPILICWLFYAFGAVTVYGFVGLIIDTVWQALRRKS